MNAPAIADVLRRVRRRWRVLTAIRVGAVAAAGAALVLVCALGSHRWLNPQGFALAMLWSAAMAGAVALLGWALWSLRASPTDTQIARFIEECCPELDDVLATVTAALESHDPSMFAAVEQGPAAVSPN